MKKDSELLEIRLKLDEAITYYSEKEAIKLAKIGLKKAKQMNLPAEVEYFKAQLYLIKERFLEAIEHFKKALEYNPYDGAAYNDYALCLVELGFIDKALEMFDKAIEVEPDFATVYHNKGWLLNNLGRHREAILYFNKALELQPQRAVTYDNLADAYFNLGDYQASLEAYEKVLSLLKQGVCEDIKEKIRERIDLIKREYLSKKA